MEYGEGGSYTVSMDGPFGNSETVVKMVELTAPVANWKGAASPYSQVIDVEGKSANSKVDIQLSVAQMRTFQNQVIAFTTENYNGVITLYAVGDKPAADCTFQATLTEIVGGDNAIIRGNTVSTAQERADYSEENEGSAGYILNKPDNAIAKAQNTADNAAKAAAAALPKSGGTMSGNLDMSGRSILNVATPTTNTGAANKGYVDAKRYRAEVSVPASGWAGSAAPYTQSVAVNGLLSTDHPHIACVYSNDQETRVKQREAWNMVCEASAADNRLSLICFEDKPEVDLTIQLEVNR